MTPLLQVRNISKHYGARIGCTDVGFDLYPGEVMGIVGESGSGKSTIARLLTRFHDLMQEAKHNAERVQVPTLMLSAGRDVFIRPEQSRAFFERLAAPQKEYVFYPDSHHLLWHDVDTDDVLGRIERWITEDRA